jgi:hypothetical protein
MGRASQLSTGRDACFIVRDANGQALAYVYFEDKLGQARGGQAAHARRGPANRRELCIAASIVALQPSKAQSRSALATFGALFKTSYASQRREHAAILLPSVRSGSGFSR